MTSDHLTPERTAPAAFVTTQWTQVLEARGATPEAKAALSDLCAAYYAPVFTFIRTQAPEAEAARDLTQEFFARLLARRGVDSVNPQRGRFRSFLLGAVKHFLSDSRDRDRAQKRGGGQELLPLESGTDTSPGFDAPDSRAVPPDSAFDRQWAFTLLDRALKHLGDELAAAGKTEHFEVLKPWLTGAGATPQNEAATRLDLSESAVKVAIHRLRSRFRDLVKAEIAQTVDEPSQVPAELNYLIEVLAQK